VGDSEGATFAAVWGSSDEVPGEGSIRAFLCGQLIS